VDPAPGLELCSGGCVDGMCEPPVWCNAEQHCCRGSCIPLAIECIGIGGGN
jgi:hypothetical protein